VDQLAHEGLSDWESFLQNLLAVNYLEIPEASEGIVLLEVLAAHIGKPSSDLPYKLQKLSESAIVLSDEYLPLKVWQRIVEDSELSTEWSQADPPNEWLEHMQDLERRLSN